VKPYFAIFLNECSPDTGGDRGEAECGASAEGWRERSALALSRHAAAVRTIRAILAVIGPHTYTVVQWNRRRTDRTVVLLG
jgi:hypothetical protein